MLPDRPLSHTSHVNNVVARVCPLALGVLSYGFGANGPSIHRQAIHEEDMRRAEQERSDMRRAEQEQADTRRAEQERADMRRAEQERADMTRSDQEGARTSIHGES